MEWDKSWWSRIVCLWYGENQWIWFLQNNIVDNSILAKDSSLGVRIPHHNYPINLCKNLNFPITTTSVNRAGENSLNDPELISDKFGNEIDLIIDAGKMPRSSGSSVYKLVNSKLKLIR